MDFTLTNEQKMSTTMIKDFAVQELGPLEPQADKNGEFPKIQFEKMADLGLVGLLVPEEYGGQNLGFLDFCMIIEELSKVSPLSSLTCSTHNLICRLIATHGNQEQKRRYLPEFTTGKKICGWDLNIPLDMDVAGGRIEAALNGNDYVLNGRKNFITNGDNANTIIIFATVPPGQQMPFIVERNTPGFSIVKLDEVKGGQARYAWSGVFKDCRIGKENLIGKPGEGSSIMMSLIAESGCATAARSIGIAQSAQDTAIGYTKERKQFGRIIAEFQAIQSMIADTATKIEAARQLLYKAASLVDQRDNDAQKYGSMAKYFACEVAVKATWDAVQMMGGYGLMKDYPVERALRNAVLAQVAEGGNRIHQIIIAQAQLALAI